MYCLNCGEEIPDDVECDNDDDDDEERFCSEECREQYNASSFLSCFVIDG